MRLIQAPLCGVGSKDGTAVAGKHPIDDIQILTPQSTGLVGHSELNKLIHKRWEKMQKKYHVKVYEIYKWDGPTGYELMFERKQLKA